MQLIRKEDAAESSKYIFTCEAAVEWLVEIDDENYGGFKFIKGISLGAVEFPFADQYTGDRIRPIPLSLLNLPPHFLRR